MGIRSYQDLVVWQKAMDLTVACYHASEGFPKGELYGLVSQLQRAAVSVPANIAEGCARVHNKEFLHHLSFASGSLAEVETHLHLAARLRYLSDSGAQELLAQAAEVGRMLHGLRKSVEAAG
jgi:four helix bundle protein